MRIKRSEILKAIRTEPLKAGAWIHSDNNYELNKNCKVCAVGAVLRQKGIPDDEIENRAIDGVLYVGIGCSSEFDSKDALKEKHYLNALSIEFETLAKRYGSGKRTREKLSKFVKANFPKQFNVKL